MRIQKIHIENFGKLHNFDLELKEGLNIIRAENGWGKSTLAAFIKAMFYGLDYTAKRSLRDNERKKYLPWQGGTFGGSLEFTAAGKPYRAERSFGTKDREDTFALYDLDTGLKSDVYSERLGEELFRVDRAAFERSSFFAQQDFSVSVNDSLNAGLTHVEEDAGDMRNYEKAAASLEARMKYYQKTGNRGQIDRLKTELQNVRAQLADLREQETFAEEWKTRAREEEQKILMMEAQLQEALAYGERAAKKDQYNLLKEQAYAKEEILRKTAADLGKFAAAPPEEEELDRCGELIYRIYGLRAKEEDAEEKVIQAEDCLKELESSAAEAPKPNILLRVLMSFLVPAGVMAVFVWKMILPGGILLAAGFIIAGTEIQKERRAKRREADAEKRLALGKKELQEAEKAYREVKKKKEALQGQVCKVLKMPEETDTGELESRWKLCRQQSRRYGILKNAYETQRREALQSREAWMRFRERFSEEELSEFLNAVASKQEPEELKREIHALREEREGRLKALRDIQGRISGISEKAEQIPELEEEEERLTQELEAAVREHGLLETTLKYLKAAREQFSGRYLKELQEGLLRYLDILEPERRKQLLLDVKLNLKIEEAGAFRAPEYFSAGWQDLFQIAERFSIIDALYKEEQPILILDDPFVNLDTKKQSRAMNLLEKTAEKRQMIYFTCRT